ncbi:MAG: phospholipase D-like domain-containing protein [Polyangiaceae bacterium]
MGGAGGAGAEGGAGPGGAPAESCDPYQARAEVPELFVGPTGVEARMVELIDEATTSIELMMYQFNRAKIANALIAAAGRGATVRVLLDGAQYTNDDVRADLTAAGIEVRDAPTSFEHAHAKAMVLDAVRAVVFSGNFNSYSVTSERNYGVVDASADDVADVRAVFEHDWSGAPLDLSCTRLVVSPDNSRERLQELVFGAKERLDMAVMYISDAEVKDAVLGRAADGVPVRVLLADPSWIDDNTATAAELAAAGVSARFLAKYELHAKLVIADGAAFVGSENLSWTSLEKNREVGVFVTEAEPFGGITETFESDWAAGIDP